MPNVWKATLCSTCLHKHGVAYSPQVITLPRSAPTTPSTSIADLQATKNDGMVLVFFMSNLIDHKNQELYLLVQEYFSMIQFCSTFSGHRE